MAVGNEKLLREFEEVVAQVADLDIRLRRARQRQEELRKALRAALRNGRSEEDFLGEPPGAVLEVVEAIRNSGKPADAKIVADLLKVSPSVARTRLQRAAKLGLLRRVSRGHYAVTTEPEESDFVPFDPDEDDPEPPDWPDEDEK